MSILLNALRSSGSVEATLADGAKEVKRIGKVTKVRAFKIRDQNGLRTTELYPNSVPPQLMTKK